MTIVLEPFSEALEDVSRGNPKLHQSGFLDSGVLPVVDQGQKFIAGYTDDDSLRCRIEGPVVLFGDHTRAIKYVDFPFVIGADGVKVLRVREGWHSKYVYHYLRSIEVPSAGYSRHFKFLKEIHLPWLPLEEQRRIAAILDHADALRAKRRQVLAHLDSLTQSIFYGMFGDPVRNDRGLSTAALGSVAEVMTGSSPPRSDPANFGDAIEWIKSDNLGNDNATTAVEWLSEQGRQMARIAPIDSILVTCIAGSHTSIGKASAVDRPVAFNQQINAVLPSELLEPTFLLTQFRVGPELVRAKSTGGMKGLVNKSAFRSIEILLPDLAAQRTFSLHANVVKRQRSVVERALASADELFASLQSRAFRGEL